MGGRPQPVQAQPAYDGGQPGSQVGDLDAVGVPAIHASWTMSCVGVRACQPVGDRQHQAGSASNSSARAAVVTHLKRSSSPSVPVSRATAW